MAIVRWWDPWGDMSTIHERMGRLFEDTGIRRSSREDRMETGMWTPAVDICETNDVVVVKAELPGVAKDQVSIEVNDGILTLRGERKFEKDVKEENYHRIERSYGTFQRSFSLPTTVEAEKISAVLADGILEVRLPKKEQAKPRNVKIS